MVHSPTTTLIMITMTILHTQPKLHIDEKIKIGWWHLWKVSFYIFSGRLRCVCFSKNPSMKCPILLWPRILHCEQPTISMAQYGTMDTHFVACIVAWPMEDLPLSTKLSKSWGFAPFSEVSIPRLRPASGWCGPVVPDVSCEVKGSVDEMLLRKLLQ